MLQIFADLSGMQDDILRIGGSDYNHIRNVLRMRPGDELTVRPRDGCAPPAAAAFGKNEPPVSGDRGSPLHKGRDKEEDEGGGGYADAGGEYRFEIISFTDDRVVCRLLSVEDANSELPVRVLLFQGLPKADKMDLIVQKAVETGVSGIIPVEMHRSIVKLAGDKRRKRVARWQSIVEAAAKQSRRALIPQVYDVMSMAEAVRFAAQNADRIFVPYERMAGEEKTGTRALLEALQPGQTAAVFIGPEGGFEESEVEAILQSGGHTVSLGRRILRTETAAQTFLAFLIYRFELE